MEKNNGSPSSTAKEARLHSISIHTHRERHTGKGKKSHLELRYPIVYPSLGPQEEAEEEALPNHLAPSGIRPGTLT